MQSGSEDRSAEAARALLSADAVRSRAGQVLDAGLAGRLAHFSVDLGRLDDVVERVLAATRSSYPDLEIPPHARWRHFSSGGVDRWARLSAKAHDRWPDAMARARSAFDLAITSVLLDAGAGSAWVYREEETGRHFDRSEGLAVASLHMFAGGAFSAEPETPERADAVVLASLTDERLEEGFQVSAANPLVGLEGRAALLRRLGETVAARPDVFARNDSPRPGGLIDHLASSAESGQIPVSTILAAVLEHFGPIWPGRLTLGGINLGDTWRHPAVAAGDPSDHLVPFHKLSQWLTYSLIEPTADAGFLVTGLNDLTGLAEYRNGGLFVDAGVLEVKDPAALQVPQAVDAEIVVEWRALTVALLDHVADLMRERLALDAERFPLPKVLEGGTWAAGRAIAREKRADGSPPIVVVSDGTVF